MAVKVLIRRKVEKEKEEELFQLITQLRSLATKQPGYISLYRGRSEIKKVPESEGVAQLIDLIKADGRWVDP